MKFTVSGTVRETDSGKGISGLVVQVMDKDFIFDDLLGQATTDSEGCFSMEYHEESNRNLFDDRPDLYLVVETPDGKVLKKTTDDICLGPDKSVDLNIEIQRAVLAQAGLAEPEPVQWLQDLPPEHLKRFTTWTWQPGYDETDELTVQLNNELSENASILELMTRYIGELKGNTDNNAPPFIKLAKLFDLGITPKNICGRFYGLPVAIRTGDQEGPGSEFGNILGLMWGSMMADGSPWVGKSFSPLAPSELEKTTCLPAGPEDQGFLGINHFNEIHFQPLNSASVHFLIWYMGLNDESEADKAYYGNEKKGGNFIAFNCRSIYHKTKREVFGLNYRFKNLNNRPPFSWLIDEMVQVGEGIYLGQLLYATRRLKSVYDPNRELSDYKYQHFGYFLLFDETWNPEARRLLPHLEMPVIAPGLKKAAAGASFGQPKFTTFTFEAPGGPNQDDAMLSRIYEDMNNKPTIMHLLKQYSDELLGDPNNDSPCFSLMQELFNRGIGIRTLEGFFRGALVSWHTEGILKIFGSNIINTVYSGAARMFSPWTGKSFEKIDPGRLMEITNGHETGKIPTFWGSNTQAFRTPKEKMIGKMIKAAGIWSEQVPPDEAREFGYDVKCFFFISRQAKSVSQYSEGKDIFQLNYRWPELKTIPPDCYCIDEMVQIADGLILGQLMYSTRPDKPYDPMADPSEYKYRSFGYFLLMDESWHQIRLDIGFDLDNV